jgi:steroid delta-isomerase-like uncharacterized protein
MGQARELMDRITEAVMARDADAFAEIYADDVVADTPDEGRLVGRQALVDWLMRFGQAFPDTSFEMIGTLDTDDRAADEAYLTATHTGTLQMPDGDLPPTGRRIRIRECDAITVEGGKVVSHRFYFDQVELLTQLGLMDQTVVMPDARGQKTRA